MRCLVNQDADNTAITNVWVNKQKGKVNMENITREALRSLNVPDEAIEEILKARGLEISQAEGERNKILQELNETKIKVGQVDELSKKVKELEQKNMSAEELQAQKIKEAEDTKRQYGIMSNKLSAREALLEAGMQTGETLDKLLDRITTEDLNATLESAKAIAQIYSSTKDETEKRVKAELLANNPKPTPSNDPNNDGTVTKEQFDNMGYEEMMKFAAEHPDEFAKM